MRSQSSKRQMNRSRRGGLGERGILPWPARRLKGLRRIRRLRRTWPFRDEVVSFSCEGFNLGEDLGNFIEARDGGLQEATVLYAARMIEALSRSALEAVVQESKPNTYSNLERLNDLNLISRPSLYWAHGLRRLGNQVRHHMSEASAAVGETAGALLQYCLVWFFCEFEYGMRLEAITRDGISSGLVRKRWLDSIMDQIQRDVLDYPVAAERICRGDPASSVVLLVPSIIAVLAEELVSRNYLDWADNLLRKALRTHTYSVRLRQLLGLSLSRQGDLDNARDTLESLYHEYGNDDETIGILAGVYKRMWVADRGNRVLLESSFKMYQRGFERNRTNTYLGINVASLALLLDMKELSARVAHSVRGTLIEREGVLAKGPEARSSLNLWDQLTMVEALFDLRKFGEAKVLFERALVSNKKQVGDFETCQNQLRLLTQYLDGAPREVRWLEEFLES